MRVQSICRTVAIFLVLTMAGACAEPPTNSWPGEPDLKPGKGKGGGAGNTQLEVELLLGSDVTDDGSTYTGDMASGGTVHIDVSPRTVTIADFIVVDTTVVPPDTSVLQPGTVEAIFQTTTCCDFRTMTAVFGEITDSVSNPNYFKLRLSWWEGNTVYHVNYGTRTCVPGNDPVPFNDPRRGNRLEVTRVPGLGMSASDTTWTLGSVGPAAVCSVEDNPGHRNDVRTYLGDVGELTLLLELRTQ